MTYIPHQMLTPEQQAEMDAHNAKPARVTKKEAMLALEELRAQFETLPRHPLFVLVDRYLTQ